MPDDTPATLRSLARTLRNLAHFPPSPGATKAIHQCAQKLEELAAELEYEYAPQEPYDQP